MNMVPFGESISAMGAASREIEALSDAAKIQCYYDQIGVDGLLRGYALEEPLSDKSPVMVDEEHVQDALLAYSFAATGIAIIATTAVLLNEKGMSADVDLIKGSFNPVYDSIDKALDLQANGPVTATQRALGRLGMSGRKKISGASRLDERFWKVHLNDELAGEVFVKRSGDPENLFLARCVYHTMSTRVFAPFSMRSKFAPIHPGNKQTQVAISETQRQALAARNRIIALPSVLSAKAVDYK